jgi:hypothetical protein
MGRLIKLLLGLGFGAGAGYAIALWLSSEQGQENVRRIRQRIDMVIAEGKRASDERRSELEAELARAKGPGY